MEDKLNEHKRWRQGRFIPSERYDPPQEEVDIHNSREQLLVRPSKTGNAICKCESPEDAIWIAERLNLAATFELKEKQKKT